MNRLHFHKITSVGVIEEAKSAPVSPRPERPAGPTRRGAAWGPVIQKAVLMKLDDQDAELAKIRNETRKVRDNMPGRKPMVVPAVTVRSEVDRLAAEIVKKGEAANLVEARPIVWRERPDLVAKSRREAPGPVTDGSVQTISNRVRQVIDEAAAGASLRPLMENWGRGHSREEVISKVRVELWKTPDGQALRDLDRAVGSMPYTPATVGEVRKSRDAARFRKALEVLDRGLQIPG